MLNEKRIMHIGCKVYAFETWTEAEEACDLFTDFTEGKIQDFEQTLIGMGVQFEIISDSCLTG